MREGRLREVAEGRIVNTSIGTGSINIEVLVLLLVDIKFWIAVIYADVILSHHKTFVWPVISLFGRKICNDDRKWLFFCVSYRKEASWKGYSTQKSVIYQWFSIRTKFHEYASISVCSTDVCNCITGPRDMAPKHHTKIKTTYFELGVLIWLPGTRFFLMPPHVCRSLKHAHNFLAVHFAFLICNIFNNAVRNSNYTASNDY